MRAGRRTIGRTSCCLLLSPLAGNSTRLPRSDTAALPPAQPMAIQHLSPLLKAPQLIHHYQSHGQRDNRDNLICDNVTRAVALGLAAAKYGHRLLEDIEVHALGDKSS